MSGTITILALAAFLPVFAQGPVLPKDMQREQVLRYLRIYHFAENARKSFLEAAARWAKPGDLPAYKECIAKQLTNENLEFNQKGLPRISGGDVFLQCVRDLKKNCGGPLAPREQ